MEAAYAWAALQAETFLKVELPRRSEDTAEVGDVMLFTKLLDGGSPVQCDCGFIWRFVPLNGYNQRKTCPSCGRGPGSSNPCTVEAYKASRADDKPTVVANPDFDRRDSNSPCCDNERRNVNGGCDNCGDPSF